MRSLRSGNQTFNAASRLRAAGCVAAAFAVVALGAVSGATGQVGSAELVAGGFARGVEMSADGSRIVLDTDASLLPADTDTADDVYLWQSGVLTLVSQGPSLGNSPDPAFLLSFSSSGRPTGSHIFFSTDAQLVAGDTNGDTDEYDYDSSTGNLSVIEGETGVSQDGSHLIIGSSDRLTADDTDDSFDVYEQTGSTTTLLSTGPAGGDGPFDAYAVGVSPNADAVLFATDEALVSSDTNGTTDTYESVDGQLKLFPVRTTEFSNSLEVDSLADDGSALVETDQQLVATDTDSAIDVYRISSSGVPSLVSDGTDGVDVEPRSVLSGDGACVAFETTGTLVPADTDADPDLYERCGTGPFTLITPSPVLGAPSGSVPSVDAISNDGSRIVFRTAEQDATSDTNSDDDSYLWDNGVITRLSPGPSSGTGVYSTADTHVLFFSTADRLARADENDNLDWYRWSDGVIELATSGGIGRQSSSLIGATADGSRALINTSVPLVSTDTNGTYDVYLVTPVSDATGPQDSDLNGIDDSLDTGGGSFADTSLSPPTTGTVTNYNSNVVLVSDSPLATEGVLVKVSSENSAASTVHVCGLSDLVLQNGSSAAVTCGSVTVRTVTGVATLLLSGGSISISVPQGVTAKVSQAGAGFTVQNLAGGDDVTVTMTSSGASSTVGPGGSETVGGVDTTPPVIVPTLVGTLGSAGWYRSNVSVTWTVTDPESTVSSTSGCGPSSVTADTTGRTFTCSATSTGGHASKSVVVKRDATLPKVAFASHSSSYTVDQTVSIACTSTDATSGIGTACQPINAPAYTFPLGASSHTTTAVDRAGNAATASTSFTVKVTAATLCTLTRQLVHASSRYATAKPAQRAVADALVNAGCVALTARKPAAYKVAINALAGDTWLTAGQATTLRSLSDHV